MAPSSSVGCLGGVAAVTVAAGGILEQVAKAILYIINRREIACLECGKLKQPEKMRGDTSTSIGGLNFLFSDSRFVAR